MQVSEKRKNAEFLTAYEQLTEVNKAKLQERAIFLLEEQHRGKIVPLKPPQSSENG